MPKYDLEYFEEQLKEAQDKCYKKAPEIKSRHRKDFVENCSVFHLHYENLKNAKTDEEAREAAKGQQKAMKKCVKSANKILEAVDLSKNESVVEAVLKGMIMTQATPEALAKFCAKGKSNTKLISHLLKTPDLMKEMLANGGAKDAKYPECMTLYTKILADFPKEENEFTEINRKIAMAVSLELCVPIYEFDTQIKVDPIARFTHFAEAYKNGELDPAFPHFTIWELRHVVDCDAINDQMKWGRDMMINYAPYLTLLTDLKQKYNFILGTDVLMRNSNWTDSPRTYQQVLSGGGKDKVNAWFGRFILKAHGIPTWGCKQGNLEGFCRWTSEGWFPMMKMTWEKCEWEGVGGFDFKGDVDARSAHTPEQFFYKKVLLECFAEVLDGRRAGISEEEKVILHPLRVWRSLSIIQKALMLEPAAPEKFERSGKGVKTRTEMYLEKFEIESDNDPVRVEGGTVIIPSTSHGFTDGHIRVIDSYESGKQLNLLGGASKVEFEIPESARGKTKLELEVCTVHFRQTPLVITIDDGEPISVEVPYTVGEWGKTKAVDLDLSGGEYLYFSRDKTSYGLAIKNLVIS